MTKLPQQFQSPPVPKNEGQSGITNYDIGVNLSHATSKVVKVDFAIGEAGDTATKDDDYTVENTSTTLTFPAESTAPQYINIDVAGDTLFETDEEFTMTLSLPAGMTAAELPVNPTWTGTITNDDDKPTVSIADSSGDEGTTTDGYVEFTVTLIGGRRCSSQSELYDIRSYCCLHRRLAGLTISQ